LVQLPSLCYKRCQPKGVVLIEAPWNYPFQLCMVPFIGALAAGNTVLLKPSSKSRETRKIISRIIDEFLDNDFFKVAFVQGKEHKELLAQRYDHIFFTGSTKVGHSIMEACSKNLTPMTLELGGKSPAIVDKTAEIGVAARRILWGKLQNAGQTCIATDYVLCHEAVFENFLEACKTVINDFYGSNPQSSPDYCRIIDEKRWDKLNDFMQESGQKFTVNFGGTGAREERYFAPTLISNVDLDAKLMQDEIFGPILPIIKYNDINKVIHFVNERPRPLALYVFSQDDDLITHVMTRTTSGGACINDTFVHVNVHGLPFGGVGDSGMGSYHGRYSWETFSHTKGILHKATFIDPPVRFPPYTTTKFSIIQMLS